MMLKRILTNIYFIRAWNTFVAIITIILAVIIPIEAAAHIWDYEVLMLESTFVTIIYTLDIAYNIFIAKQRQNTFRLDENFHLKQYFRKWFIFDLLAVLPFGLFHQPYRLIRLAKLIPVFYKLRLARLRILAFTNQLLLINLFLVLGLVTHWIACGWLVIRGFDLEKDLVENYVNALYWSITTITTVGYGDVVPLTYIEKIYAFSTMLVGLGIFGYFIGYITSILSKKDPAREHYLQNIEQLSLFVKYRSLDLTLQRRIHDYYTYKWQRRLGFDEQSFLEGLPPGLKMEVALHLKKDVIESIPLFREAPQSLIEAIALHLQPVVCTPGDYVFKVGEEANEMYFIVQGKVKILARDGKEIAFLQSGDFFGEISLFKKRTRTASVRAESYCDLYRLSRVAYDRVISKYPGVSGKIEKEATLREERNLHL